MFLLILHYFSWIFFYVIFHNNYMLTRKIIQFCKSTCDFDNLVWDLCESYSQKWKAKNLQIWSFLDDILFNNVFYYI